MRKSRARGGSGFVLLCAWACCGALPAAAEWLHDAEVRCMDRGVEAASLDDLMFHASRYGDTPEKQVQKQTAYAELERRGPAAFSYLVGNVHRENIWFYLYARRMLDAMDNEDAVEILRLHLDSPEDQVRKTSAFLLGFCHPSGSLAPIRARLDDDETAGSVIRTLGLWKDVESVSAIARYLSDSKESRRVQAAVALGEIGDTAAVPALVAALSDSVFTVRNAAQQALVALDSETVGAALLAALPSMTNVAARQAIRVLGEIRYEPARQAIAERAEGADPFMTEDAQRSLRQVGGKYDE